MKNPDTDECIVTLLAAIRRRSEIYSEATGLLNINNELSLRSIFRQYQEESAAAMAQLLEDLGLDADQESSSRLNQVKTVPLDTDPTDFAFDVCAMLRLCKNIEAVCTRAYQQAIRQIDETLFTLSYHIREQAEEQYMASNHINTLLDCNLLNRQAV